MTRIDDMLAVSNGRTGQDYKFSGDQVIAAILGTRTLTERTTVTVSYGTTTVSPTVYYTALRPDGSVLTSRTPAGIVLVLGLYTYNQNVAGVSDFIALWDEGDPAAYTREWIVVDT